MSSSETTVDTFLNLILPKLELEILADSPEAEREAILCGVEKGVRQAFADGVRLSVPDAEGFDPQLAYVFDPYLAPDKGESVLVRSGSGFRIETYHGQECLGRWQETHGLDDGYDPRHDPIPQEEAVAV